MNISWNDFVQTSRQVSFLAKTKLAVKKHSSRTKSYDISHACLIRSMLMLSLYDTESTVSNEKNVTDSFCIRVAVLKIGKLNSSCPRLMPATGLRYGPNHSSCKLLLHNLVSRVLNIFEFDIHHTVCRP